MNPLLIIIGGWVVAGALAVVALCLAGQRCKQADDIMRAEYARRQAESEAEG